MTLELNMMNDFWIGGCVQECFGSIKRLMSKLTRVKNFRNWRWRRVEVERSSFCTRKLADFVGVSFNKRMGSVGL